MSDRPMTLKERVEAAAKAIHIADIEPSEAPEQGWNELRIFERETYVQMARRAVRAAFPELFSDPPTHWLAPMAPTALMYDEAYKAHQEEMGTTSREEYAITWLAMRDAHLAQEKP